jgi:hypothetical protein
MALKAEMNYRLSRSTKRALFAIAEKTGTTAAAVVRGNVEVLVAHPRWATVLKEAGLLAPSDRVPSRGLNSNRSKGGPIPHPQNGGANPLIQGRVSRKLGGKP